MSPSKTSSSKVTASSKGGELPAALAKNAEKSARAKQARLAAEARADIALIRARRERIGEDFYDIGEALTRLKRVGVAESLGCKGFAELCEKELDMAPQKAAQLVAIVKAIPREQARKLGQERASALLALAEATPEADTAMTLAGARLKLPEGNTLDLAKASTREIREAAKSIRQAARPGAGTQTRGATTSPEERSRAAALQAALHGHGLEEARVVAVARSGRGALVRIERVPLASLPVLAKAIGETTPRGAHGEGTKVAEVTKKKATPKKR